MIGRPRPLGSRSVARALSSAAILLITLLVRSVFAGSGASIAQLSGPNAQPTSVAADGQFAVGSIGNGSNKAVRWSSPTTFLEFPDLPGYVNGSMASDVSNDGAITVGSVSSSTYGAVAVRWTLTSTQGLWGNGWAEAISGDGRVVVGSRDIDPWAPFVMRAMTWTEDHGAGELPLPAGYQESGALDVSADGRRILGEVKSATERVPIVWDAAAGQVLLPQIPGATRISGMCISGDGALVGVSVTTPGQFSGALWDAARGYLPLLATHNFQPLDINHDGSVVVGNDGGSNAYRWSSFAGMRQLRDFLIAGGADMAGWSALSSATGVSPDGRWITGRGVFNGQQTGFIAFAPECIIADLYVDGFVDGVDLAALLAYWGPTTSSAASQRADLNRDGYVNADDLGYLLSRWGPCTN
jgi:uncharacterized membrane protein